MRAGWTVRCVDLDARHARDAGRLRRRGEGRTMDWKLELVAVPVSDVDRAKAFYTEKVGFNADHDHRVSDELRFVQLTPPASACSWGSSLTSSNVSSSPLQKRLISSRPLHESDLWCGGSTHSTSESKCSTAASKSRRL